MDVVGSICTEGPFYYVMSRRERIKHEQNCSTRSTLVIYYHDNVFNIEYKLIESEL